jgi:hypothetical protein
MSYGPVGAEFTATNYNGGRPLALGAFLPAGDREETTLQVVGFEGKTWSGAQWYRFRVVPATPAEIQAAREIAEYWAARESER